MSKIKKGDKLTLRSILYVESRVYQKGQQCVALADQVDYDRVRVVMIGLKDSLGYDAIEYISKNSLQGETKKSEPVLFRKYEVSSIVEDLKELEK